MSIHSLSAFLFQTPDCCDSLLWITRINKMNINKKCRVSAFRSLLRDPLFHSLDKTKHHTQIHVKQT